SRLRPRDPLQGPRRVRGRAVPAEVPKVIVNAPPQPPIECEETHSLPRGKLSGPAEAQGFSMADHNLAVCKICGSSKTRIVTVLRSEVDGREYDAMKCCSCGVL